MTLSLLHGYRRANESICILAIALACASAAPAQLRTPGERISAFLWDASASDTATLSLADPSASTPHTVVFTNRGTLRIDDGRTGRWAISGPKLIISFDQQKIEFAVSDLTVSDSESIMLGRESGSDHVWHLSRTAQPPVEAAATVDDDSESTSSEYFGTINSN